MVAFAKLQELIRGRPITYPLQQVVNGLLFAAILAAGIAIAAGAEQQWLLWALIGGASHHEASSLAPSRPSSTS